MSEFEEFRPVPVTPEKCECLDPFHEGQPCKNAPADHGTVVTSPALCMACLFSCDMIDGKVNINEP